MCYLCLNKMNLIPLFPTPVNVHSASEADAYALNKLYDEWVAANTPRVPITSEYENYPEQLELPVGIDLKQEQAKKWKSEGKCPTCGELGAFINLGMTCSKHGSY